MLIRLLLITTLLGTSLNSFAQIGDGTGAEENDFEIGGDIFSDFNEDLEASQVMEDERFYRYSRFFAINVGLGVTNFTGNRGLAYKNNPPSYNFGLMYFINFHNVFIMGLEYSQHTMFIDTFVSGSPDEKIGVVESRLLRPYFGFRYYIDTSDLGTAITYSNPYFTGRAEYWYQTRTYPGNKKFTDESGGGIGTAFGAGLEFPIELKKSYFNIEVLYHIVNFDDKFTTDYRQIPTTVRDDPDKPSDYGYDNLAGDVITVMCNYNISW